MNFLRCSLILIFFCLVLTGAEAEAELSLQEAIIKTSQAVKESTVKLNTVRQKNSDERIKLSSEVSALEGRVAPLREKVRIVEDLEWQKESGFQQLKDEVAYLREEIQFCSSLLNEYHKDMRSRLSLPEVAFYQSRFDNMEKNISAGDIGDSLEISGALLSLLAERNQRQLGGAKYPGKAADSKGIIHSGTIIQSGPLTYFIDENDRVAGLLDVHAASTVPSIAYNVDAKKMAELRDENYALIPVDTTLGEAVKVTKQKKSLWGHIQAGGIVMIPILGLGICSIVLTVWKAWSLKQLNLDYENNLQIVLEMINHGKTEKAMSAAESLGLPLSPVLMEGIKHYQSPKENVEEMMHERILAQLPFLEKYMAFLAVAAAASPLLGLLGTVTGMIHTFDLVAVFGTGKVNILSGGISEALITTEFGLLVAIPVLLIHAYFNRRVRHIVHTLEHAAVGFINGLQLKKKKAVSLTGKKK